MVLGRAANIFLGNSDMLGGLFTGLAKGGKYRGALDDLAKTQNIISSNINSPDAINRIRTLGKADNAPSSLRSVATKLDDTPIDQQRDILQNEYDLLGRNKQMIEEASSPSNSARQMNNELDNPVNSLWQNEDNFGRAYRTGEKVRNVGSDVVGNPIIQMVGPEIALWSIYAGTQPSQEELMRQQQEQMY